MKRFKLITMIVIMVGCIIMAFVAPHHVSEFGGKVILVGGMVAGALGMLLIILTDYVFPNGLYMSWWSRNNSDLKCKQVRIL